MTERWKAQPLLEEICTLPNLTQAWRKVRANVRLAQREASCGVDEVSIATFEQQWETNLVELQKSLLEGSYQPLPPRRVELGKPGGGKRVIGVLAVRDRVAQRAAQQVLEPIFESHFLDCSYGFRPGRCVDDAVHRVLCHHQAGCDWVFNADIAACFDSLDHALLLRFIEREVSEPAILDLIQGWLEAEVFAVDGETGKATSRLSYLWERGARWVNHQLGSPAASPSMEDIQYLDTPQWEAEFETQTLWQRVRSDLLLLGLAGIRPTARRLPPLMRRLARRKKLILGVTGTLSALGLAGIWWGLRQWEPEGQGALQGGALSPLLANIYLHHLDEPVMERKYRLVRYADDFVICCETQQQAEIAAQEVAHILSDLRLRLNGDKSQVINFERGFRFLGRHFRGDRVTPALHYRR